MHSTTERSHSVLALSCACATTLALAAGTGSWIAEASAAEPREPPSTRWIDRHPPRRGTGEVGVFGGVLLPSRNLELFEPDDTKPDQGFRPIRPVAPEIGLRGGYYPLRFLGVEAEGALMPSRVIGGPRATLWSVRGHVVGQLGLWSVTPFLLAGGGVLGVASDGAALGTDADSQLHFGGGVKVFATRRVILRFDARDVVSNARGVAEGLSHSGELLLGVSIALGGKRDEHRERADTVRDRDGDGFLDDEDACVRVPGDAPDGCPHPDSDGDGFLDEVDECPTEVGVAPDGCPRPDRDHDRIADVDDACPDEPETSNGFRDADGCPDVLPREVAEFTASLQGIEFETDSALIKGKSHRILDEAVKTLQAYPDVRVEIGGHTDATGSREYNLDLSRRRARAVERYLVDHGLDASRLSTRGYGPDRPIDSNDTASGRARNRRIEFEVKVGPAASR